MNLLFGLIALLVSTSFASEPPRATQTPKELSIHGDVRTDNYYWMLTYPGTTHSKEFVDYAETENRYTESKTKHLNGFQKNLVKEMISRTVESDLSVPEKVGDYEYYTKTIKGKDYPVVLRKNIRSKKEEVLLDCNILAAGKDYFDLNKAIASPDHNKLLYVESYAAGNRALFVKDLKNQKTILIRKGDVSYPGFAWAPDNRTIFFSAQDQAQRPHQVVAYDLVSGTTKVLFEEKDTQFELRAVELSQDGSYLLISTESKSTSETYFMNLTRGTGSLQTFLPRSNGHKYLLEHHEGQFYILSNKDGANYGLYRTSSVEIIPQHWQNLIAPSLDRSLEDLKVFKRNLVVLLRQNGLSRIEVIDLPSLKTSSISFEEPYYELEFPAENNLEYDRDYFLFSYKSFTTPGRVFRYRMSSQKKTLVKDTKIPGGFKSNAYKVERLMVTARDGVKVPVSLIYKKDLVLNGSAPLFLNAYGNYGYSFPIGWSGSYSVATISPLLDRGVIYAIAHIRGGGELGPVWYLDGKLHKKKNTFHDFIDVTEYLIAQKYTNASKIGARSLSAGGLLLGYITNNRPELYKAVIAAVPFVDLLTTMLDEKIPLTTQEWEEWGNPNVEADYAYMKSYSPYDNVSAHEYPNMLVKTALKDTQVMVHEPTKWVAKIRDYKTDSNDLLLLVNTKGGHGGSSGQYAELEEVSFDLAWILEKLGITQ